MKKLGIDTGGSFTRIWDGQSEISKLLTPRNYGSYLRLLKHEILKYTPVQSLVIALPSAIEEQCIFNAPNLGKSWCDKDILSDLHNILPEIDKISIIQDTEAAVYGIMNYEGIESKPAMVITLSTGIGGALVLEDFIKPLEIGHMIVNISGQNMKCSCGQIGCVEADLSGSGILRRTGVKPEKLFDLEFWCNYGKELGRFLSILVPLFRLKLVILIGGITNKHEFFLEQTKQHLNDNLKYIKPPEIRISSLVDKAGVYGAYWLNSVLNK